MSTELVHVPVPGTDAPLQAVQIDARPFVALRPICDSLGVDYSSQLKKLRSRSWATVVLNTMVAADGLSREMALIDRRTMTMWLATLDENRVGEHACELVVAYQREAADALDAYFNAPARPTTIDGIRAMCDQIEAAQRDADEAKRIATCTEELATRTEARLDAIEGRHDWFAALGYARHVGITDTSLPAMSRLGRRAAAIARKGGITPERVQHQLFGQVNLLPVWVWEAATEQLELQVAH
jgi:P22_AR N-terminal domain